MSQVALLSSSLRFHMDSGVFAIHGEPVMLGDGERTFDHVISHFSFKHHETT